MMTENIVKTQEMESIKVRLDSINACFEHKNWVDLLNQKYKDKLEEKPMPKEGASLGLIDVARKSGNKLLYEFQKLNADYSIFKIIVSLNNNATH
jgi:hypothetical protein